MRNLGRLAKDFLNGLSVTPLEVQAAKEWTRSAITSPAEHPWRHLFRVRKSSLEVASLPPQNTQAPPYYTRTVNTPGARPPIAVRKGHILPTRPHETVRLSDVEAFRAKTRWRASQTDVDVLPVAGSNDDILRLLASTAYSRPVIYRYADVIKNEFALLEAIHFELFMPDRPDLRFLAVPLDDVPRSTVEGDLFHVFIADRLDAPSFTIKLGLHEYPVVWQTEPTGKIAVEGKGDESSELAYVLEREEDNDGWLEALNARSECEFPIRETLFRKRGAARPHTLVRVTMRDTATAHLYAVEPLQVEQPGPPTKHEKEESEALAEDELFSDEEQVCDDRHEYVKLVCTVRPSSNRVGRVVSAASAPVKAERARIRDRLGEFKHYGAPGDLELMDELFRLGARYRAHVQNDAEYDEKTAWAMESDSSMVLRSLNDAAIHSKRIEKCRPLLDCIYGREEQAQVDKTEKEVAVTVNGVSVPLNAAQARAIDAYENADGPRVFIVRSPPGSGKTMVAAAMTAEVARETEETQLLLSVQNVAVNNMGAALKKMNYGEGMVYNMKSNKMLDPYNPAPFDYFDLMDKQSLQMWRNGFVKNEDSEIVLNEDRIAYEKGISPKILLATVEMALAKMMSPSALRDNFLRSVKRIIIDEASLLPEAALYALIRRFPEARFVLIGDDKQLPPYQYNQNVLGHELAGRPALSVAMKTGKVPVVELNEVYRAPPVLVAPYNRLAYGGRLVSKKVDDASPLSEIGLVNPGSPQLLLIDVDGEQDRNPHTLSLYNNVELQALHRLMRKFPDSWKDDIMVICLYREQWRRLQSSRLGENIKILTVDSAQGKESPIVVLMTTRTQASDDKSFFDSVERCNVAVSRQQKALIILGKADLLTSRDPWSTVVNGDDFTRMRARDIY